MLQQNEIDELQQMQIIERNGRAIDPISVGAGKNSEVLKALGDGNYTIKYKNPKIRNLQRRRYKVLNGVIMKLANRPAQKKEVAVLDTNLTAMPNQSATQSELIAVIGEALKPVYMLIEKLDDQKQKEMLNAINAIKSGDSNQFMQNFSAMRDFQRQLMDQQREEKERMREEMDDDEYDEDYEGRQSNGLGQFGNIMDYVMPFVPKLFDMLFSKPKKEKIRNQDMKGNQTYDLNYVQELERQNAELRKQKGPVDEN